VITTYHYKRIKWLEEKCKETVELLTKRKIDINTKRKYNKGITPRRAKSFQKNTPQKQDWWLYPDKIRNSIKRRNDLSIQG
jgi:hypothetical protein